MLHDAFTAIRHNASLAALRKEGLLSANTNRRLATPAEMAVRFRELPEAIANSVAHRPALPGLARLLRSALAPLCHARRRERVCLSLPALPRQPAPTLSHLTPAVLTQLAHELAVIEQAGLAGYFLIVWDIVRFARDAGHPLPGPGLGGQLHRRLSAGHHQHRPAAAQPALRALSQRRQVHHARHRHRLCRRPPRGGDPVRLPALWRGAHGHGLQRRHLSRTQRPARPGQGAGLPAAVVERLAKSLDTNSPTAAADRSWRNSPRTSSACRRDAINRRRPERSDADPDDYRASTPPPAAGEAAHPLALLADSCARSTAARAISPSTPAACSSPGRRWTKSCRWSRPPCRGASWPSGTRTAWRTPG